MKTLTIEFPTPGEEETPANSLARHLHIHPWAVALVTLGWPAAPRVHHTAQSTGPALHPTWYVGSFPRNRDRSQSAASTLLNRARGSRGLPPLSHTDPAHPFLAITAALTSLAALQQWQKDGGPLAAGLVPGTAFLSLHSGDCLSALAVPATHGVVSLPIAASLITAGFFPAAAAVTGSGGQTGIGFAPDPLAPGLLEDCLRSGTEIENLWRAGQPWQPVLAAARLGQALAGEHPFLYALAACLNLPGMLAKQAAAARNPVRVIQNRFRSSWRVLVTNSLTEGSDARARQVKELMEKHLKAS